MNRSMKRNVGKIEALDFAAGTYNTRTLRREHYNQHDFLQYLSAIEMMEFGHSFDEEILE